MNEQDYSNVLNHLRERMQQLGFQNAVSEINNLISRGKTVEAKNSLSSLKISKSDVGSTQTLPLTSREALELAIDYLSKAIVEVPSYAQAINETFGDNVFWAYDDLGPAKLFDSFEGFSLESLLIDKKELENAQLAIMILKDLLKDS